MKFSSLISSSSLHPAGHIRCSRCKGIIPYAAKDKACSVSVTPTGVHETRHVLTGEWTDLKALVK